MRIGKFSEIVTDKGFNCLIVTVNRTEGFSIPVRVWFSGRSLATVSILCSKVSKSERFFATAMKSNFIRSSSAKFRLL